MEFYDYVDWFRMHRQAGTYHRKQSDEEIFRSEFAMLGAEAEQAAVDVDKATVAKRLVDRNDLSMDYRWSVWQKPYVKVWPELLHDLTMTDLEIDGKYLKLPYPNFVIRLPTANNPYHRPAFPVTSVRVSLYGNLGGDSALVRRVPSELLREAAKSSLLQFTTFSPDAVLLELKFQYQPKEVGVLDSWSTFMNIAHGELLAHQLQDFKERARTTGMDPELAASLGTMSLACCFFMVGNHSLLRPDIPAKLKASYEAARGREKAQIVKEAVSRGFNGSTLGEVHRSSIPMPPPPSTSASGSDGGGWHLHYRHPRRGHIRILDYEKFDVTFVRPTIVRPDLPRRDSPGYDAH
jgi:hypothetical protein